MKLLAPATAPATYPVAAAGHLGPKVRTAPRQDFDAAYDRSKWAEDHTDRLIGQDPSLVAVPYGHSRKGAWAALDRPPSKAELADHMEVFKSTETYGKRPDLLVFNRTTYQKLVDQYGKALLDSLENLADSDIPHQVISQAVGAIEVEQSAWDGKRMPDFGKTAALKFKTHHAEYHGIGFAKAAKCPHIFIKDSDLKRLQAWREHYGVPLFVSQFYMDSCYLLDLSKAEQAIAVGAIPSEERTFSEREEARKVYKIWYTLAEEFADVPQLPEVFSVLTQTRGGQYKPEVLVQGGEFCLRSQAIMQIKNAASLLQAA